MGAKIEEAVENLASAISAHLTAWETSDDSSYLSALSLLGRLLSLDDLSNVSAHVAEAHSYLKRRRRELE